MDGPHSVLPQDLSSSTEKSDSDDNCFQCLDDKSLSMVDQVSRDGSDEDSSSNDDRTASLEHERPKSPRILTGPFVKAFKSVFKKRSRSSSPRVLDNAKELTSNFDFLEQVSKKKSTPSSSSSGCSGAKAVEELVLGLHGPYLSPSDSSQLTDRSDSLLTPSEDRAFQHANDENVSTIRKVSVTSKEGDAVYISSPKHSTCTSSSQDSNPWTCYRTKRSIGCEEMSYSPPTLANVHSSPSFNSFSSAKSQLNRQSAVCSDLHGQDASFSNRVVNERNSNFSDDELEVLSSAMMSTEIPLPTLLIQPSVEDEKVKAGSVQPSMSVSCFEDSLKRTASDQSLCDALFLPTCILDEENEKSSLSVGFKDSHRQPSLRDIPGLLRSLSRKRSKAGVTSVSEAPNSLSLETGRDNCIASGSKSHTVSPVKNKLGASKSLQQSGLSFFKGSKQNTLPSFKFGLNSSKRSAAPFSREDEGRLSSDLSTDEVFVSIEGEDQAEGPPDSGRSDSPRLSNLLSVSSDLPEHDKVRVSRSHSFFRRHRRRKRTSSYDNSCAKQRDSPETPVSDSNENFENVPATSPTGGDDGEEDHQVRMSGDFSSIGNHAPVAPRRSKLKDIGSRLKKEERRPSSSLQSSEDQSNPASEPTYSTSLKSTKSFSNKLGKMAGVSAIVICSEKIRTCSSILILISSLTLIISDQIQILIVNRI